MLRKSTLAWGLVMAPLAALAFVGVRAVVQSPSSKPAVAFAAEAPVQTNSAEKAINSDANEMLKRMTDYLAGLQSFKVEASSIDEVVTKMGQKIQIVAQSRVAVARPNRLRSEQIASPNALSFTYDGKTMSLYCAASNTYATVPAPTTLDATIDTVRKQYDIDAPGADLLYSHPYDILTEQVKHGQVIGHETIDGAPVNHLAFEGESVDWQVWIKDGSEPLPLRYVITTKTMQSQPQFTVEMSHWEPHATINESEFDFKPPSGAKKVAAFPTTCGTSH